MSSSEATHLTYPRDEFVTRAYVSAALKSTTSDGMVVMLVRSTVG
jgi:hypothetical protein